MGTFLSITWSLSAEEQFYLMWPPLQKYLARPRRVLFALVVLIGLSQVIHFNLADGLLAAWFGLGPDEPAMLKETTFAPILFGVLLAYGLHFRRSFGVLTRLLGNRWMPAALLVGLGLEAALVPADIRGWPRLLIHITMTALLASSVLREDHALMLLLRMPLLRRIGVVSYGMYLWHMFVEHFAHVATSKGMPSAFFFPAVVLGSLGVAELSYRLYETPFLRLKRRFSGDGVRPTETG